MDTLRLAQKQALAIHLSIATMKKPSDILKDVDELLHTLTGLPKHFDTYNPYTPPKAKPVKKKVKRQAPIPTLDKDSETIIIKAIQKNPGITQRPLSRITKTAPEKVKATLHKLLREGKITTPGGFRGPRRYSIATPL